MWPRVLEVAIACWLAMSPFIFRYDAADRVLWITDWASALALAAVALVSFWSPLRYAHFLSIAVALWLLGFAFLTDRYAEHAAMQNYVSVGLLLLMIALLPNEASLPPRKWRAFLDAQG